MRHQASGWGHSRQLRLLFQWKDHAESKTSKGQISGAVHCCQTMSRHANSCRLSPSPLSCLVASTYLSIVSNFFAFKCMLAWDFLVCLLFNRGDSHNWNQNRNAAGVTIPATGVFSKCSKTKKTVFILIPLQSETVLPSAEKWLPPRTNQSGWPLKATLVLVLS